MKPALLIVDDEEEIRAQMRWALAADYDVVQAEDRPSALAAFRRARPAVVLLDLGLPPRPGGPEEGLAALAELLALDGRARIVVVTGQGEKEVALRAVAAGAHDFVGKPLDIAELKVLLKRCYHVAHLERELREQEAAPPAGGGFEGLLGTSPALQGVVATLRKVAASDAPVFILGESGTGKEMTAQAIHRQSARKDGPFVAINCGAIPETLMESELFGHEKGAFTGAHAQRKGRIETAAGGTLFLDEIGEISPALQVKLLRYLQEKTLQRVGGRQDIRVDARVVTATHADIPKRMREGAFREDLYYRLAVVQLQLPPLRERGEDIAILAQAFLERIAAENGKTGLFFGADALRALRLHRWPGNIRELQNRVRRAVIMSGARRVTAHDLELEGLAAAASGAGTGSLKEARDTLERGMVQDALRKHGGRIAPAAAELGISRPTFYEMMDRLGVQKPEAAERADPPGTPAK